MKANLKIITLIFCIFSLIGCSNIRLFHRQQYNYLKSQAEPGLIVPAGLSRSKIRDAYAIPVIAHHGNIPASITPPTQ